MSLGLQRREPSAASYNRDILGWMSEPGSFGLFPPLPFDPREVISLSGLVVYNMQGSVYTILFMEYVDFLLVPSMKQKEEEGSWQRNAGMASLPGGPEGGEQPQDNQSFPLVPHGFVRGKYE